MNPFSTHTTASCPACLISLKKASFFLFIIFLISLFAGCRPKSDFIAIQVNPDFIAIQNDHFVLHDTTWFPKMVNYKIDWRRSGDSVAISPAIYYENANSWEGDIASVQTQIKAHFTLIHDSIGANALRICMDVLNHDKKGYFYGSSENPIYLDRDSALIFSAFEQLLQQAQESNLRIMCLLKAPLDKDLMDFTAGLLSHFAHNSTIWAYDFMNEPLYFDPQNERGKKQAFSLVASWRDLVRKQAPYQLFTIGFAEPIEVFEWDPQYLPVDFIQMHTYHPLRVASEMYWYGQLKGKPWMVGETSLPADNDSISYHYQTIFMQETFRCAVENGACGYGWWEFQDCPQGVNFEAQYTGFLNHTGTTQIPLPDGENYTLQGSLKPAAHFFASLDAKKYIISHPEPLNYKNMLGYSNIVLKGNIVDAKSHRPIQNAAIRGWNDDWSVGMNTFSDSLGNFTLYSNDYCVHFEISAPGMSHLKFDRKNLTYNPVIPVQSLTDRQREYQQIDYSPFLISDSSLLLFHDSLFFHFLTQGDMGTLKLEKLSEPRRP